MFGTRVCITTGIVMCLIMAIGCRSAPPRNALQQSQLRAQQLYQQNKMLAMERNGMGQTASQLAAEKAAMEQQYLAAKQSLDAANARLGNLASANNELEDRMRTLLVGNKPSNNPLSDESNRRLEEMRKKYKDFDFDPHTGVSKFSTDLLFASGSDDIQPRAKQILDEFAQIMNQGDARSLKVLVSGHTDDKPVSRKSTADKHHDNMGLSANRALSVMRALRKSGINENRMGISGYGAHQPVEPNSTEQTRQKNRRVEIYVLAPDTPVASAWDPSMN
ncbi:MULTISPECIES: OmpA family protein [unclassified Schlesneria]|uniref:OmpA/MotB family protein n=1 Tax=Schlesneria TaxID=656899 RepID=UPI002F1AB1FB